MSERLNGKTAWEFACEWYMPEEIAYFLKNRYRNSSDTAIPDDIDSAEFAQWLCWQYRLAMEKGIEITQSDCAAQLAAAEARCAEMEGDAARDAVSWFNTRKAFTEDNTRLRGLLREACEMARAPDDDPERWYGNEITDEWFDRVTAALEGKP